jgi:hypothetical protein
MPERPVFDPLIQTEKIAFDPEAMIACERCGRMNPPNRLKCIYCAMELEIASTDLVKPSLRKLELWEKGFNVIVRAKIAEPDVDAIAELMSMERDEVTKILDSTSLPIARVESEREASIVQERLAGYGVDCLIVGDADLAPEKPPIRLSAIEFLESGLAVTDLNTRERTEIERSEFVLLVSGVITSARVESLEKKRRGGESKPLDEAEMTSDEALLDIYTSADPIGFRINLSGFDFSCLADEKGLLAGENMRILTMRLVEHVPNARFVDDYADVRPSLDIVWELEARRDSKGLQPMGFGKAKFGAVASSSNLNQFTKYSRLQWHLL